jgi:hypothetical protein
MTTTTEVSAINKAEIIAELENMVVVRLFCRQPWLADRETCSAIHRKLIQICPRHRTNAQLQNKEPSWSFYTFLRVLNELST